MIVVAAAAGMIVLIATGVLFVVRALRRESRDFSVDLGKFGKFQIGSPWDL
jgi:cell division septation protein DedD